jgi:hypothetical protein
MVADHKSRRRLCQYGLQSSERMPTVLAGLSVSWPLKGKNSLPVFGLRGIRQNPAARSEMPIEYPTTVQIQDNQP